MKLKIHNQRRIASTSDVLQLITKSKNKKILTVAKNNNNLVIDLSWDLEYIKDFLIDNNL